MFVFILLFVGFKVEADVGINESSVPIWIFGMHFMLRLRASRGPELVASRARKSIQNIQIKQFNFANLKAWSIHRFKA